MEEEHSSADKPFGLAFTLAMKPIPCNGGYRTHERLEDANLPANELYESGLPVTEATFKILTDAMPQMVWSTLPNGFHDYYNERWYEFTGAPRGSTDGEGWAGMFHEDDQPEAWRRWQHSLETGEPYEVEYRLRHHTGHYRWTIGRAQAVRDQRGTIVRWIGTCTDIHEAKLVAEANELLTHELSHRIKNIFSVVSSLIALTAREFPDAKAFALRFRERVSALGRAHEFVRLHSESSRPAVEKTTIQGLLASLFEPYPAFDTGRIAISGDDPMVDDRGATPLALLFHELVTNAIKYGALSNDAGIVEIHISRALSEIVVEWAELGGPAISAEPSHTGFGSKLALMSVERQLGGKFSREWLPSGLRAIARVEESRLARSG